MTRSDTMVVFPTKNELMDSIIKVLEEKKSMTTADINRAVSDLLCLTKEQLFMESSNCSGFEYGYRMRWAGPMKGIHKGICLKS